MNIGIIRDTLFINEPRGLNIAKALISKGYTVHVLCFGEKNEEIKINEIQYSKWYLNTKLKKKISPFIETIPIYKYLWAFKIKKFIKKYNIDVLQVHDLYMLGPAILANKSYSLPIVANFHENYPAAVKSYNWANSRMGKFLFQPNRWKSLETKYLKKVSNIIVTCKEYKEKLLIKNSQFSSENIVVYVNTPDIDEFSNYPIDKNICNKEKDEFIIFYFGVNAERRGLFTILDSIKYLSLEIPHFRILLIGPLDRSDQARFAAYQKDKNISSKIEFIPWKSIQYIPSYISKSDVCISPLLNNEHHNTTIANKLFQYMLYRKAMVISDCTPQKSIIKETESGLLHRAGDAEDLANKIIYLFKNKEISRKMGEHGNKWVLKKYNSQFQSLKVVEMYDTLSKTLELNKTRNMSR